jgi:ABC-2 type transport system ATP-binding protein
MISPAPMIELRRLHRFFGATRAVQDVTFEVYRGQVFGYIGPNGAGKTTSMRILATLDLPTAGDALVDGFSCINDPDRVRRRLGFMPDYFGTYANVNCYEYLDFFARARTAWSGASGNRVRRHDELHAAGRTGREADPRPSKGMKQRLCLGRAMIHDPAVLILDEPAAGLDPRARIELRIMIRELAADGKTILISSHILTELAEMCDQVGIIEQGRLLAVGSVNEIQRAQRTHSDVKVRVLGGGASLSAWLSQRDDVEQIEVDGELVHFSHQGNRRAEAALLKEIIEAGFEVIEFGCKQKSLEDVFMQVTRGAVQ